MGRAVVRLGRLQQRASAPLAPGRRVALGGALGTVFVERLLGAGSFGRIYAVRLEGRAGSWALKVVPVAADGQDPLRRAAYLQRRCAGAGVVAVQPPHFAGRFAYLLMERIDGPSLETHLVQTCPGGRAGFAEALAAMQQMVAAVSLCHAYGVVHQDVKPDNFLRAVGRDGRVKLYLSDFDAARERGGPGGLGTATYLAPEALAGGAAQFAGDVWALGVSWYRLLVGIEPYCAASESATLASLRHGTPLYDLDDLAATLRWQGVAAPLREGTVALVAAALQRDPAQRLHLAQLQGALSDLAAMAMRIHRAIHLAQRP